MSSRRRQKVEMEALDMKIRPLYERGLGCRIIGKVLEENPATILRRARHMGISRTQNEVPSIAPNVDVPFTNSPDHANLSKSAIGIAVHWFLQRGYMVSIPVEPAQYDIIVESDRGLQRVQVKTTNHRVKGDRAWTVQIHRKVYDPGSQPNAGGKRRSTSYTKEEIDLFFIVTGDGDIYTIPVEATCKAKQINLDTKYASYKQKS